MGPMVVYTLRFRDRAELQRSFRAILDSERLEDCLVERDRLQIRILAPSAEALKVIEKLYLYGGLTWCSRHELVEGSGKVRAPR